MTALVIRAVTRIGGGVNINNFMYYSCYTRRGFFQFKFKFVSLKRNLPGKA